MRSFEIWRCGLLYPRFRATDYKEYPFQLQTRNSARARKIRLQDPL